MPDDAEDVADHAFNEYVAGAVEEHLAEHVDRVRSCLAAVRMAGLPLDWLTASALNELSVHITAALRAAEEDGPTA